jgi:hypothetical protein
MKATPTAMKWMGSSFAMDSITPQGGGTPMHNPRAFPVHSRIAVVALALGIGLLHVAVASAGKPGTAAPPGGGAGPGPGITAAGSFAGLPRYVPPASFREDMVVQSEGKTIVMKRAYDGTKIRTEMNVEGKGLVMIELGDEKGSSYILMPDDKRAMKQSRAAMQEQVESMGKAGAVEDTAATPSTDVKVEDLGDDTVNGVTATKVRMTSPEGTALGWFDKTTGAPLRMEGEVDGKKSIVEWKDRKVEPQPAALFEIPKGYEVTDLDEQMAQMRQMSSMAGSMKGMTGGMLGGMAEGMGQNMGAGFGSALGGAMGGPLGAMAGQYIGGKVGRMVGHKAAGAVQ